VWASERERERQREREKERERRVHVAGVRSCDNIYEDILTPPQWLRHPFLDVYFILYGCCVGPTVVPNGLYTPTYHKPSEILFGILFILIVWPICLVRM